MIVGLGNPGKEYASTRHNVGFQVLDRLRPLLNNPTEKNRFRAEVGEGTYKHQKIVLVAPQTYMNLSGHAVREARQWFRVDFSDLLVVLDDMDLPFGTLRIRAGGTAGGHNGLKSIIEQLGTDAVPRLRVGIGHGQSSSIGHVLSKFNPEEEAKLPALLDSAAEAVLAWAEQGIMSTMNSVNRRSEAAESEAADPL
jgi:peptidyl-tRNA hydrolase, PTH1 family